jgi:hypothetical protein
MFCNLFSCIAHFLLLGIKLPREAITPSSFDHVILVRSYAKKKKKITWT